MQKWKRKLTDAKNLRKRGAGLIYDRMKLLIEVYSDPEFLADEGLDELSAAGRLDDEVADVCAGFLELKAVMEFYPQKRQWQGRRLDLIVAEVLEAERLAAEKMKEPRKVVRATKAQLEQLQQERDQLAVRVTELREENRDLTEEVGKLKGRIVELESLLSKEPVAS